MHLVEWPLRALDKVLQEIRSVLRAWDCILHVLELQLHAVNGPLHQLVAASYPVMSWLRLVLDTLRPADC